MTTSTRTGEAAASTLWITLFAAAGLGVTALLACATPFTALAALAATQMRQRDGIALMLVTWTASQALAIVVHGYPLTSETLGWAAALAVGAVAATLAARVTAQVAADWRGGENGWRLASAYVAAMLAFKGVILLGAVCLNGGWSAFAPAVLVREGVRNGAILIALYALYRLLVGAGVPAADQRMLPA